MQNTLEEGTGNKVLDFAIDSMSTVISPCIVPVSFLIGLDESRSGINFSDMPDMFYGYKANWESRPGHYIRSTFVALGGITGYYAGRSARRLAGYLHDRKTPYNTNLI